MIEKLWSNTSLLQRSLDASFARNDVISQNIANVDTPGFKKKSVEFESLLQSAIGDTVQLRKTNPRHLSNNVSDTKFQIVQDNKNFSLRLDGNNVDIDNEMASMAKNTIKYNTLIQNINSSYKRLKTAISEGKR